MSKTVVASVFADMLVLALFVLACLRVGKSFLTAGATVTRHYSASRLAMGKDQGTKDYENRLLELIGNLSGRGSGLSAPEALPLRLEIEKLISELEGAGLKQNRDDEEVLNGCWRLMFTSLADYSAALLFHRSTPHMTSTWFLLVYTSPNRESH